MSVDHRAEKYADINKKTGEITFTEAAGDDVVRLVNNGEVEDRYIYGENGSFTEENKMIRGSFEGIQGTALVTVNSEKAQTFFEFAAQSDVEFGKLDVEKKWNSGLDSYYKSPTNRNIYSSQHCQEIISERVYWIETGTFSS